MYPVLATRTWILAINESDAYIWNNILVPGERTLVVLQDLKVRYKMYTFTPLQFDSNQKCPNPTFPMFSLTMKHYNVRVQVLTCAQFHVEKF